MTDIQSLIDRIDAEFAVAAEKAKKLQAQQLHEYHQRKNRREAIEKCLAELRNAWQPRLEALVQRFGDRVLATTQTTPIGWEDNLSLQSDLARVRLKFSASTDSDARQLTLDYNLEVIPVFMRFASYSRLELAPDSLDLLSAARWMDDRVIDFVQIYLSLQENHQYLRDHLVEDPIAQVRFAKSAAAATLEWNGQSYYFIAEETRQEFAKLHSQPAPQVRSPQNRETNRVSAQAMVL